MKDINHDQSTQSQGRAAVSNVPCHEKLEYLQQRSRSDDECRKSNTLPTSSLESASSTARSDKSSEVDYLSSLFEAGRATCVKPIVSPLAAVPDTVKTKLNRKTLNKLKRKRLEESKPRNFVHVSFSGKSFACVGEPITNEGRVIFTSLRLGNFIAHEFVSLVPSTANRWTLKSHDRVPTKESKEEKIPYKPFIKYHPNLTQNIFESVPGREPTFFLSSNKEADQSKITIESLAFMLMAMNAGMIMSCCDRYGEVSYDFLLVPHERNGSKVMGLACVWNSFPSVPVGERLNAPSQGHMECASNEDHLSKKMKIDTEKDAQNNLKVDCSRQNNADVKPLSWNELVTLYELCVSQQDGAPLPIEFATEKLFAAVVTLWNGENCTKMKFEKLQTLFELLRCSDGNIIDVGILKTKNELSQAFKARHPSDERPTRFVTLILLQILIRIQLLSMHNDNDDERNRFLDMFSRINCTNGSTKAPTRKKKTYKIYTMDHFTSELCSLAEMLPFTLPSPSMFSSFLSQEVLKPCQVLLPSVLASMSDYFELDLSEQADNVVERDEVNESHETQLVTDDARARWSKSISPKHVVSSKDQKNRQKMPAPCESEEKILFGNNFDVTVKTKNNNPLLSDNKGRYVGRQFSGNYFREIKVFKPKLVKNVKPSQNEKEKPLLHSKEYRRPSVSETPERRTNFTNILRPSSSVGTLLPMTAKSGSRFSDMFNDAEESNTERSSSKTKHPHAAVIKALAVMRKRR